MSNKEFTLKQVNYEIFVVILTVLSWVNCLLIIVMVDEDSQWLVLRTEQFLTVFFLLDFMYRLKNADSRSRYFKKYGWLDLLGSLPFLRWLRAYRVYMTMRYLRKQKGRFVIREFFKARAETAALTVILAVIFLFEFASIFVLYAENGAEGANILTAGDAVWWVLVTVATVGYGDSYPVTENGRFIAIFVIIAGVGLFGILSGFLTRTFLGSRSDDEADMEHITSNSELDQILAELKKMNQIQEEDRLDRESADKKLQERLVAVEKLLGAKKLDEG